jgi:hypothetical protein
MKLINALPQPLKFYGDDIQHLNKTGANLCVIGASNHEFFPYPKTEMRPAMEGEIVALDGKAYRIVSNHNGQRLRFESYRIPDQFTATKEKIEELNNMRQIRSTPIKKEHEVTLKMEDLPA